MDLYSLTRDFWDFCFENPEKINPNHIALYMWTINQWNRFWNKEKFSLPAMYAMEAIWIKSKNTFYKTYNDLINFWFIKIIEKSKNQNTANIIAVLKIKSAIDSAHKSALDSANIQHISQQREYNNTNIQDTNIPINNLDSDESKKNEIIVKEDKRDMDIDLIIESLKEVNWGILDDTIKKQRQYGKLIKDKMNKIKWFNWDYASFIHFAYNNSDIYRRNYFRSCETFYYHIAWIIAGIRTTNAEKPRSISV